MNKHHYHKCPGVFCKRPRRYLCSIPFCGPHDKRPALSEALCFECLQLDPALKFIERDIAQFITWAEAEAEKRVWPQGRPAFTVRDDSWLMKLLEENREADRALAALPPIIA